MRQFCFLGCSTMMFVQWWAWGKSSNHVFSKTCLSWVLRGAVLCTGVYAGTVKAQLLKNSKTCWIVSVCICGVHVLVFIPVFKNPHEPKKWKTETIYASSARGPLSLLGMSHFASCKMFAECTFSWGVIVFDYKASMFHVCKNFTWRTFSRRVVVFDYQACVLIL